MEEIKKDLEKYKLLLKESSKKKYEQFHIYSKSESEYKKCSDRCDELQRTIDILEKRLSNELLGDIIGKYVLYKSYREDTKIGSIMVGKIVSMRTSNALNYEGITIYYTGDNYDTNSEICINSVKYNSKLNSTNDWISISNFESGLYEIISKEDYISHIERFNKLIGAYTEAFKLLT